jgi:hypothetical protein
MWFSWLCRFGFLIGSDNHLVGRVIISSCWSAAAGRAATSVAPIKAQPRARSLVPSVLVFSPRNREASHARLERGAGRRKHAHTL